MLIQILKYSIIFIAGLSLLGYILIKVIIPGGRITSWYRTPERNRTVGGVPLSKHLMGLAYDVVPVTEGNIQKLKRIFPKVINERDHIHAAWL